MGGVEDFQHPRFARFYLRISARMERHGAAELRDRLLAGLAGRVVEVGAGNGLNFDHYPDTVTEVVAVEPDRTLRAHAEAAAARVPVPVKVVTGHADALPGEDGAYDAAVASLVLCSVPDQARALAEFRRVLRPGGELRFWEHVRSDRRLFAMMENLIDPVWSRVGGGCHLGRDTATAIRAAGFAVEEIDRFVFDIQRQILGRAHKM